MTDETEAAAGAEGEIVRFTRLSAAARLPTYATEEAAAADLHTDRPIVIPAGEHRLLHTGLGCDIAPGWEIQLRPRSGLANKHVVTVLNGPATIDPDYNGELMVLLINHSRVDYHIEAGDRIAQMSIARVIRNPSNRFHWSEGGRATGRGAGGFGSTGV